MKWPFWKAIGIYKCVDILTWKDLTFADSVKLSSDAYNEFILNFETRQENAGKFFLVILFVDMEL